MNHELTILLVNSGYVSAIATWLILSLCLVGALFQEKWETAKRICKYFINSIVFVVARLFYLEFALIVRAPVAKADLRSWISQHTTENICFSAFTIVILFVINFFFYRVVEKAKHKFDLFLLIMLDTLVLISGAWIAGQDAYYGFLEEINRGL